MKRLLKLGLRLLPLLLGSSHLLLVGATATPTGGNTSPQAARAGLPPAAGNAKLVLDAAARSLASPSSSSAAKGAARALGGGGGGGGGGGVKAKLPVPLSAAHHHRHGQRLLDDHSLVKLLFLIIGLVRTLSNFFESPRLPLISPALD